MKVMSLVGTRPELIKMSAIMKKLDEFTDHVFVHTGQNHDYELNEIFYKDLELRQPDYYLGVAGDSLGRTIASIMRLVEEVLIKEMPDAVVILGDTNSALGGIMAKRMKIPLFHLEAGNRCFDDNVPEEINRRILDHISDVNMPYTENSRRYLLDEGVAKDRIFIMGSPMKEIFNEYLPAISESKILGTLDLIPDKYFVVSIHRDENIEIGRNFEELMATLEAIVKEYKLPVIVSTHPRLRKKLEDRLIPGVEFMKPLGFFDYVHLQMRAKCVISDSGTIAEESSLLHFPAITIRNAIERPEAIDVGSILMTGVDKESILRCLNIVTAPVTVPVDYSVDNTSERVLKVILAYTGYVNRVVWRKS